jgi:hypothetical protein
LGFEDQDRQIRLIGRRQEQAIEPVLPFLQHRRAEHIALHPGQEFSHQRLEAFGMLLEQPVEELVAGDHGEEFSSLTAPRMPPSGDGHQGGSRGQASDQRPPGGRRFQSRRYQPIGFSAMMGTNAQKGSGARRALPMP